MHDVAGVRRALAGWPIASAGCLHADGLRRGNAAELGGFVVSGPCDCVEITRRYGRGDYRVTAYQFEPAGLLWEVLVEDLTAD